MGGVFLCVGGYGADGLISALGAPGGPALYYFGEREYPAIPNPKPGQAISMHYSESEHHGQLRFFISHGDGEIIDEWDPIVADVPLKSWRPYLLLSFPDTRVQIVSLI